MGDHMGRTAGSVACGTQPIDYQHPSGLKLPFHKRNWVILRIGKSVHTTDGTLMIPVAVDMQPTLPFEFVAQLGLHPDVLGQFKPNESPAFTNIYVKTDSEPHGSMLVFDDK